MASELRRARVAEQILKELGEILHHRIKDPRKGWLTVTRVELSRDLLYAKVGVSVYGDEKAKRDAMDVLRRAGAFIRSELGKRLRLRQVPEIHFKLDESIEYSQRIHDILESLDIPPAEPGEGVSEE